MRYVACIHGHAPGHTSYVVESNGQTLIVLGGHLSFPGIGHIRAAQGRYLWAPATYAIPR